MSAALLVVLPVCAAFLVWPRRGRCAARVFRDGSGEAPVSGGRQPWGRAGRSPLPSSSPPPVSRPHHRGARQRREQALDEALVELLGLLAAPLRSGVPPMVALVAVETSARAGPLGGLVADLVTASRTGEALAPVWARWGRDLDSGSLAFVARAWALSEDAGAPLVDALAAAAEGVRARRRARERLATAASGPRASMTVLSLLPASGPLVGLACGINPVELYLGNAVAATSLGVGLALAALAAAWSRRILRAAS